MKISGLLKKATVILIAAALGITAFSGCGQTDKNGSGQSSVYVEKKADSDYEVCIDKDSDYSDIANYTKPKEGEEIVVMTIKNKGEIKIKLFSELLPKACANFIGLAKHGYYDGLTFHRIIADFMIQGGDPDGTGMGGSSVWGIDFDENGGYSLKGGAGSQFDGGSSKYLYHVNGALAYANSGATSTDGSQFFIVVGNKLSEDVVRQYNSMYSSMELTDAAVKAYTENGGSPFLDGSYTVFGQVFEGMDLVNDICNNTETDENDKPVSDVVIESVKVIVY